MLRSKQTHTVTNWIKHNRKRLGLVLGGLIVLTLLVQLFYPGDKMPLFASVDGVNVGGQSKKDVIKKLDQLSNQQSLTITLGNTGQSYEHVKLADIGMKISNANRINNSDYPWYLRLVPSSLLWFGLLQAEPAPTYTVQKDTTAKYVTGKLTAACLIDPKNAGLELNGASLKVTPSKLGGTCSFDTVVNNLATTRPVIGKSARVTIPVKATQPSVGDKAAKKLADELMHNTQKGVSLKVAGKTQVIPQKDVLSWLDFAPKDKELTFMVSQTKSSAYIAKNVTPLVTKPAGITKVTTVDFTETSRNEGATGQTLALGSTLDEVASVLSGKKTSAVATTTPLAPTVQYTRSYTKSSTGIAAQIKNYDDDNAGVFGVSFIELGGQGLRAQHNGDRQFVTASTYKLFVAFSTLKKVDAGQMQWSDANIASGRNLSTCFDDMIVKSDNACAEALIKKNGGASALNADIKSIGLNSTAFRSDNNVTTANDLATYLTKLEKNQLPLKPESRSRLLDAMKRNVYRKGIPAGASGQTADKVGFLWALLHDAAIVYSPKGTYVLVVMSDGSTWDAIADLTRKIEALR